MINNNLEFLKAEARADKYLSKSLMNKHRRDDGYLRIGDICVVDYGRNHKRITGRQISIIAKIEGDTENRIIVFLPLYRGNISTITDDCISIDCIYCEGLDGYFYVTKKRCFWVNTNQIIRKVGHLYNERIVKKLYDMVIDLENKNGGKMS